MEAFVSVIASIYANSALWLFSSDLFIFLDFSNYTNGNNSDLYSNINNKGNNKKKLQR